MKHSEFIEKFNTWLPRWEERQSGKKCSEIASALGCHQLTVASMTAFVERNKDVPRCDWLGEFTQESVKGLASRIRLSSKQEMRESLITHFAKSTDGAYKPYPKFINPVILRHVLDASGLKWGELNGKPVVQWNEKP